MLIDTNYLTRIDGKSPDMLLHEPKFLDAQKLFFEVVQSLDGTVDFEIADMREVHAIAALPTSLKGIRVLDLACGSVEPYVLDDTFRDRYPPFFAEMLTRRDAEVTGIDIRKNPRASYKHLVGDVTKKDWTKNLDPPYDIVACLSLFNAPSSPFEHDKDLCDRILDEMIPLLAKNGVLIATLQDQIMSSQYEEYMALHGLKLIVAHGNTVWAVRASA